MADEILGAAQHAGHEGESGLTHYAIGKAAGVAPAQLDRFVAGERGLSLATAAKVAAALGLVLVPRR